MGLDRLTRWEGAVAMDRKRTGVLLLRAWLEEEPPRLRVRITEAEPQETVGFGTTPDEVAGKVRDWLERFRSDPSDPDDPGVGDVPVTDP